MNFLIVIIGLANCLISDLRALATSILTIARSSSEKIGLKPVGAEIKRPTLVVTAVVRQ